MTKLDAVKQSPKSILDNSKNARKAYDKTWNSAARAPVFCKITKKTSADGKVHYTPRLNTMDTVSLQWTNSSVCARRPRRRTGHPG
jgi:hypothetical protein